MKGKYHIVVQNNRLRYELDIRRNITIIRGDSATGKTTLLRLLEQADALGEGSGVDVVCERPCRTLGGADWRIVLPSLHEQILFIVHYEFLIILSLIRICIFDINLIDIFN